MIEFFSKRWSPLWQSSVLILLCLGIVTAYAQQNNSTAIKPRPVGRLTLETLNQEQRKHLETYWQINKLRLNNQFSVDKYFEPKYGPFVVFVSQLQPLAQNEAMAYEAKANEFFQNGNNELYAKATKRMNMCKMMSTLCSDAAQAYKNKRLYKKLDKLMGLYSNYEAAMTAEGLALPKRNWLTPSEAEMLISVYYNIKKSQTKASPKKQ